MDTRGVRIGFVMALTILLIVQTNTARAASFNVTIEPNMIVRGELFDIKITNATQNATIVILWVHENVAIFQQTFRIDQNGTFTFTVAFSNSLEVGLYQLWITIAEEQYKAILEVKYTDRERYLLDLEMWGRLTALVTSVLNAVIGYLTFLTLLVIAVLFYMHYRFHRPIEIVSKAGSMISWVGQRFTRRQYDPYQKVITRQGYDPIGYALHQMQTFQGQFDECMKFADLAKARAESAMRKMKFVMQALKLVSEPKNREKLAHELKLQVNEYRLARARLTELEETAKESQELKLSWENQIRQIAIQQKITFSADAPVQPKVKSHGPMEPQEVKT